MRLINIEGWTQSVADQVKAGRPIEDARVEIKSAWPEPPEAARRIAAHANSAGGESILWIVGLDEKNNAVVGADKQEMANWWPAVQSEFNEVSPSVTDLNVHYDGKIIVALLFDTDRAPFVVRNPKFGQPGSGSVSLEVPWREGTATRSATRSNLVRLLLPLEDLPEATILGMYLLANKHDQSSLSWRLDAKIYIALRRKGEIVIPIHTCSATADIGDSRRHVIFDQVFLLPYPLPGSGAPGEPGSHTIRHSPTEIIVATAGMVFFRGHGTTGQREFGMHIGDPAHVRIDFVQTHDSRPITLQQTIKSFPGATEAARWGTWGTPVN